MVAQALLMGRARPAGSHFRRRFGVAAGMMRHYIHECAMPSTPPAAGHVEQLQVKISSPHAYRFLYARAPRRHHVTVIFDDARCAGR